MSDMLVAIYTERFASLGNVRATEIAQRWLAAPTDDARRWLETRYPNVLNVKRGERLLRDLYVEAGWMGYASAKALMRRARQKAISSGVDWGNWTPGHPEAALALLGDDGRGQGMKQLLDDVGITIRSINETRLDQLAMLLSVGVDQGMPVRNVAELIESTLSNASRAEMIAHTEMTRATNAATNDRFRKDGVSMVAWEVADDNACEECMAHDEDGPYPIDEAPQPPEHPWCGCMLVPVEFDNEVELQYSEEELADMDEFEANLSLEDVMEQVTEQFDGLTVDLPLEHATVETEPTLSTAEEVLSATPQPRDSYGYKAGDWQQTDLEAEKRAKIEDYRARKEAEGLPYKDVDWFVDQYAQGIERAYGKIQAEFTNGDVTVRDMTGLTPEQMKVALGDIDLARNTSNVPGNTVVEIKNNRDFSRDYPGRMSKSTDGYAEMAQGGNSGMPKVTLRGEYYKGEATIAENHFAQVQDMINQTFKDRPAEWRADVTLRAQQTWLEEQATNPNWSSSTEARASQHIAVHEFGHATDSYYWDAQAKVLSDRLYKTYEDSLPSSYAKTNAREAYAESFAQWVLTRGTTVNEAVLEYARVFGWRKP
jgi:hypothetical protein